MKKKLFKLFLVFGVIVLSIFAFIGCEAKYENLIEDEELIEFIISSHPYYLDSEVKTLAEKLTSPDLSINLIDMYRAVNSNQEFKIKEYYVSGEYKTVACYAPKKVLENILEANSNNFIKENCNTFLFQKVIGYMEQNGLSYRDLGLSFCYVDENSISLANRRDVLIYLGEIISAKSTDGDVRVCAPLGFHVNEENLLIIETDNSRYLEKKFLKLSKKTDVFLSSSDIGDQRACAVEEFNGQAVIKISMPLSNYYREENRDFFDLISPAFISRYEEIGNQGELRYYVYVYDYQMLKGILNVH